VRAHGDVLAVTQRPRHVQSPARGDAHAGFGGRPRETLVQLDEVGFLARAWTRRGRAPRPRRVAAGPPARVLPPATPIASRPRRPRPGLTGASTAPATADPLGAGSYDLSVARQNRLSVVLLLNALLTAALVVIGLRAHSLALLAAGSDYLGDVLTIAGSLFAIGLSQRPCTPRHPHGHPYATNIAALINTGWLLLSVTVLVGAFRRLTAPAIAVSGLPVLIASAVAAVAMLVGALILGGNPGGEDHASADGETSAGEDLNVKAVLLDTAAEAVAAAGVAVSGVIIYITGRFVWLDPTLAAIIAVVIGYQASRLIHQVAAAITSTRRRLPLSGPSTNTSRPGGSTTTPTSPTGPPRAGTVSATPRASIEIAPPRRAHRTAPQPDTRTQPRAPRGDRFFLEGEQRSGGGGLRRDAVRQPRAGGAGLGLLPRRVCAKGNACLTCDKFATDATRRTPRPRLRDPDARDEDDEDYEDDGV